MQTYEINYRVDGIQRILNLLNLIQSCKSKVLARIVLIWKHVLAA